MNRMWDGGYWTVQSLSGLGNQRALRDCNIEEVRAHYRGRPTSGMTFDPTQSGKTRARELVLDLFSRERYPQNIKVLTMPGKGWIFEVALLQRREDRARFRSGPAPRSTRIHAVENDRGVYYEALLRVPGLAHPRNVIRDLGPTPSAERVLNYRCIPLYIFGNVDDHMVASITNGKKYHCAWLDYFGPLTLESLAIVQQFFNECVSGTLVLTSLKARWSPTVSQAVAQYGDDYEAWMRHSFVGAHYEHYIEYDDSSPMVQFAISKRSTL